MVGAVSPAKSSIGILTVGLKWGCLSAISETYVASWIGVSQAISAECHCDTIVRP